jgi:hypothetical protein
MRRRLATGFLVSLVAVVLALVVRHEWEKHRPLPLSIDMTTRSAIVRLDPKTGIVMLHDAGRTWERDVSLSIVVDGQAGPLTFEDAPPTRLGLYEKANVTFDVAGQTSQGTLTLTVQPDADSVGIQLSVPSREGRGKHSVGVRAEVSTGGRSAFLSGVGEIADTGAMKGQMLLLDAQRVTLGFASAGGPLDVAGVADESDEIGTPMRLDITGPTVPLNEVGAPSVADLHVVLGSSSRVVGALARLGGEPAFHVKGEVTGASGAARVYGLDASGSPELRIDTDANGHFATSAPASVIEWYATLGSSLTSTPVRFVPGTASDLKLDVAPGGTLRIRVTDPDTKKPLTARIIVRGEGSTLDPSFGPDYRATGAGPLIDALRGEVETPLPEGHYRVLATKGIEWSIDEKSVVISPGHTASIELAPRHVVPSDGVIDCDLHVHARPSFDSPVTAEDRVLSLVAAGIDFAVPSEHNIVGDYGPMLGALDLTRELSFVTGVEVTTYSPRFGHFGVYPYPKGPVPPFRATNAAQIFAAAHKDPARILQVNHPRLSKGIGYFDIVHFDNKAPKPPGTMRTDFDAIEVYNGFDANTPERVLAVLHDWYSLLNQGFHYIATGSSDSHRVQYQWAGYPRTMVSIPVTAPVDEALGVDPLAVISALKKGHAYVTSGPILDLEVEGAHPGEEASAVGGRVRAHITVRAAPWVDVTSVDIVVGGRVVQTIPIEPKKTITGPEEGSLRDAQLRTLRLEETVNVDVVPTEGWVLLVAHGTRKEDDVLPFMPVPPLAFTNPVWLIHDPAAFFGPPRPKPLPQGH